MSGSYYSKGKKLEVRIGSAKPVIEMFKLFLKAIPHHEGIICKVIPHNDLWREETELAFSMAETSKCPTFGSTSTAEPFWESSVSTDRYIQRKRSSGGKQLNCAGLSCALHLCAPLWQVTVPRMSDLSLIYLGFWSFERALVLRQLNQSTSSEVSNFPTCTISF